MMTEQQMAEALVGILAQMPGRRATFDDLFKVVPRHVPLAPADRQPSRSRPGEFRWMQRVRNIVAHAKPDGSTCHPQLVRMDGGLRLRWGKP
jgi:hypothetical protein